MMTQQELFTRLAIALAVGLLIGLERGWEKREFEEGERIAGVRTFALIGILGALWALLAQQIGSILLGFAFIAFAGMIITAYAIAKKDATDHGITSAIAALLTFVLGAVVMQGFASAAAAAAVVTAVLLGTKPILHDWIERLDRDELYAIFQMLLISVVMLPVLPNRGFGPWQSLNPYEIWWMIVLIAGISLIGYFAIKVAGPRLGLGLTALLGGLVSSTAVTFSYARIARKSPALSRILAAGILLASGTMFLRTLLIATVLEVALVRGLIWPLGVMTGICYAAAAWLWWSGTHDVEPAKPVLQNPFELKTALQFGVLLALIMLAANALKFWFGDVGIYLLAAASGIADVDPVTLSLARMVSSELAVTVAIGGIVIAVITNTIVKGMAVIAIAGGHVARLVSMTFLATIALGGTITLSLLKIL